MRGIAATSTPTRGVTRLLYGDAFRQVTRLVDVAAPLAGHEVREELQGHHVRNRREELGDRRDLDPVELHLGQGIVALADQGDHRRIASGPCLSSPAAYPSAWRYEISLSFNAPSSAIG